MKLSHYAQLVELENNTELEKVELLAFYVLESKSQSDFTVADVCAMLVGLGYAKPNATRLKGKVAKSKAFVKGGKKDHYRLSVRRAVELRSLFPDVSESEEIISDDSLLPEVMFNNINRIYLKKTALQINSTYENNLFDGCALLMRRLLEILLIHCFQNARIESQVQDDTGSFQNLKTLINKAKSRSEIPLSPDAKKDIDEFRELGNLSAHRLMYSCRRDDIRVIRLKYRAVVEELLHIAFNSNRA